MIILYSAVSLVRCIYIFFSKYIENLTFRWKANFLTRLNRSRGRVAPIKQGLTKATKICLQGPTGKLRAK